MEFINKGINFINIKIKFNKIKFIKTIILFKIQQIILNNFFNKLFCIIILNNFFNKFEFFLKSKFNKYI